MSELASLIRSDAAIDAIAGYLDGLGAGRRRDEVTGLGRAEQARLWDKAADAPVSRLSHFVPDERPALTPVHHAGRNTIATLEHFQRFEKRFARPRGEAARLFGYNHSNAWFIEPGYFVAYETDGRDEWVARGGVVIDYHRIPDAEVPSGWPRVVPNSVGLQRFVYHQTRDFMRSVSAHASIGRASRERDSDELLDYWFTLCRNDPKDPNEEDDPR